MRSRVWAVAFSVVVPVVLVTSFTATNNLLDLQSYSPISSVEPYFSSILNGPVPVCAGYAFIARTFDRYSALAIALIYCPAMSYFLVFWSFSVACMFGRCL